MEILHIVANALCTLLCSPLFLGVEHAAALYLHANYLCWLEPEFATRVKSCFAYSG